MPLLRCGFGQEIRGVGRGGTGSCDAEGCCDGGPLPGTRGVWGGRDEESGAAAGDEVEPRAVEFPGDVPGDADAVRVVDEEGAVLGQPEGEGVDAHAASALPDAAAGVIAGALKLEDAGSQVADGVAAEEKGSVAGGGAEGLVEGEEYLCIGSGAVVEVPAGAGWGVAHVEAPLSEKIVGGEVVLDELVPPGDDLVHLRGHHLEGLGDGGVEAAGAVGGGGVLEVGGGKEEVGAVPMGAWVGRIQMPGRTPRVRISAASFAISGKPGLLPGAPAGALASFHPSSMTENGRGPAGGASEATRSVSRRMPAAEF